jgi:two-component system cell cycle sensor histidine kinase/response regulator CckA
MPYIPKILIVDDEPRMCTSLKMLLSDHGYEINTSNTGKEAIEYLSKNNFDLVLLDVVMPDMGGLQVMDYIEAQSLETLIIVITGYASVESAVAALRNRAYDYLRKPFEYEELLKTVENALEEKRLNSERKRAEAHLRESTRKLKLAYDQSIIYAQQLKEEVAERKRIVEALFQAKVDWENTFDGIADMVMLLDNEHQILRVNKAAADALNTTKESLVGKKCYEAMHGQSHPIRRCPLELTMKTLEPHTTEITEPNLGGTFICSTSPIVDRQGKLAGYTHTLKDITKSKRLEAQFQQAQKLEAIGTLAGGIAHDFNNLLMGIQGNVSLMMVDIDSTHPYYERLKKIEKQVQSGARLTSHLLGYARKGKYEVKPVDLNTMLKEASETFGRTRKEITIHRELAEGLLAIEADSGQIEQVLLNLFVNAADAMPGGGDLILKTMNVTHKDMKGKLYDPRPGKYVLLMVTDTGIGMDKETTERIFEPFFTTKEMGRGTGLGLASAYGIIKGHGGYIDVESRKEQGATFCIYLPASERKVQEAVKTAEPFIKGTGTVLLVDDEEVILEVGKELLEGMGYRVLIAKDGKEAIEVYEKDRNEIDIVVLDMVMPNMGGGETYDRMKEINPEIKVLLSSGFSIDGEASEILERGCNGFIQKPFTMKRLSGKTRDILEKK